MIRLVILVVAIAVVRAGVMVLVGMFVRTRCPACRRPSLALDQRTSAGGIETQTGATMFRCAACSAEYRRAVNSKILIPREAWDGGAREAIPQAKTVKR